MKKEIEDNPNELFVAESWNDLIVSLSSKAKRRLKSLGVVSIDSFFSVTRERFLVAAQGLGTDHWKEVVLLQESIRHQREIGDENENSTKAVSLDEVWALGFSFLSVRTKNGLKRLGVDSPAAFMAITQDVLFGERGMGKKCWREVEVLQKRMLPYISSTTAFPEDARFMRVEEFPFFSGISAINLQVPDSLHPDTNVSSLGVSARASSILSVLGIETLGELLLTHENVLLDQRNCGKRTIQILRKSIHDYLDYRDNPHDEVDFKASFEEWIRNFCATVGLPQYSDMIVCRICKAQSLEATGKRFGCTRERVRQVVGKFAQEGNCHIFSDMCND